MGVAKWDKYFYLTRIFVGCHNMGTVESNNRGGINRSSMHSSIEDDDRYML